jgi:sirohydrochlorin ferrochelatase
MLSPGRHSTADIPRLVAAAASAFPQVTFSVTPAFGVHEKLAELILDRAGIEPARSFGGTEADRCWDPDCSEKLCGDACRAKTARQTASPGGKS